MQISNGKWMYHTLAILLIALIAFFMVGWEDNEVCAQPVQIPEVEFRIGGNEEEDPGELVGFLQLLLILALLSLAPAFIVLMTSFTRIVVVMGFVRNALATQQIPPNQVLVGLALFLTFFIMYPVFTEVNEQAIQPYLEGEITQEEALEEGALPVREFMFSHTREKDLALFVDISKMDAPMDEDDVPLHVLVPSFVISELKTAFEMGFWIYVPFLIIDMVVATVLMSMGMMMLPPVVISMPFKILLFLLVDGWHLVTKSVVESFL